MKGEEINFLGPYDTKLCMLFFWFYQHFSGTCILVTSSFGSSTTSILIVYFLWIPELYCLRFKEFCEDVSVCYTALFHLERHAAFKTLGRMWRMCLQGSWGSTLEVFCLWNSPLRTPAPDCRRCPSRSVISLGTNLHNKTWISLGHFHIPVSKKQWWGSLWKQQKVLWKQ